MAVVVRMRCVGANIVTTPTISSAVNGSPVPNSIETVTVTLAPAGQPLNADGSVNTTTPYTMASGNIVLTGLTDGDGEWFQMGKFYHFTVDAE